jgi:hypothetical protein
MHVDRNFYQIKVQFMNFLMIYNSPGKTYISKNLKENRENIA